MIHYKKEYSQLTGSVSLSAKPFSPSCHQPFLIEHQWFMVVKIIQLEKDTSHDQHA
jgi:hypothetical protein